MTLTGTTPIREDHPESTGLAGSDLVTTLWRGGYPAIFDRGLSSTDWLAAYAATLVERDVGQLLNIAELEAFRTFLGLCAGRSASLLSSAGEQELGRARALSQPPRICELESTAATLLAGQGAAAELAVARTPGGGVQLGRLAAARLRQSRDAAGLRCAGISFPRTPRGISEIAPNRGPAGVP